MPDWWDFIELLSIKLHDADRKNGNPNKGIGEHDDQERSGTAMAFLISGELKQQVAENVQRLKRVEVNDEDLRSAAVAILITRVPESEDACVLLTLRPTTLKRHAGQYALPGGRMEPGESAEQTALREMEEEVGLRVSSNQVIGCLDDFATRSGFCITPVVVWEDGPVELSPDPNEVEQVFHIPLVELNRPDVPEMITEASTQHQVISALLPSIGERIYAPTIAILYQFREVALRNQTTRVGHYEQPQFAWR